MSLGETITRLRKQKGWRQKELADRLGTHPRHVTRWETDRVTPRMAAMEKLADIFGVPMDTLLSQQEAPNPQASTQVEDRELRDLLTQVHKLDPKEQEALKTFLNAMVKRVQLEELIRR